ncbi:hypothetical protein G8S55_11620 [Clostridium botulinum C]|uniref:hypothetical protein n=1 Tax=Clostridium botulinum TaxID=1491 RepID=UPI001E34E1EB|nr:hypothetical protein [Clostridium botulinum]MCD3217866.1 hypothetical protein [Clostridium botulinum C]
MRIKILDNVLRHKGLTVDKEYTVINTIIDKDDVFYVVKNDNNITVNVIEGLVKELN